MLPKFDHDELFRTSMDYPILRREFFEAHLPSDIKESIDFSTLKLEKGDFIDPKLKESICDVLFSVKFNGEDGFLFTLIEHQSKPDKWIAFRLLKYMVSIWDRYRVIHPKTRRLPPVYPVVFYNGTEPYNIPTDLWSLFTKPSLAKKFFVEGYDLVNLREYPDEKLLRGGLWLGILELFMKNSRTRNLLELWKEAGDRLPEILEVQFGNNYIESLVAYTLTHMEENDTVALRKLIKAKLKKEGGGAMATAAERLWNDGRQEGIQEGMKKGIHKGVQDTAMRMLAQNFDMRLVANLTGLSALEVRKLKAKLKQK